MCSPAVIPYIIMAVGTAYTMKTEHDAAKYQAQVDTNNSKLADQQAINANAAGSYAADQARIRGQLARGSQLAAFAANNVEMSTGSAADILGDTAMFTAQDERQARTNAALQSYGFQVQSLNNKGAAKYATYSGKTQMTSSFLQGASSMAGMASNQGYFNGGSSASLSGGSTIMTSGSGYGATRGPY